MQAVFVRGEDVLMVNYTPSGVDIAAGDVVIVNEAVLIAHRPIDDGELGALAISGGTYKVAGDAAIAVGKKVYWNDSANKVTETVSGNKYFGKAVEACTGDTDIFEVEHASS